MSLFPDPPPPAAPPPKEEFSKKAAKQRLMEMVMPALETIRSVMSSGDSDDAVPLKAAFGILDRAGFGVHASIHSTISIDENKMAQLPRSELAAYLAALSSAEQARNDDAPQVNRIH